MKRLVKILRLLAGVLFLGGAGVGLFFLIRYVGRLLVSLDPSLAAGIVAASATVIVSVISVLIAKHIERRADVEHRLREKKTPIYESLIDLVFDVLYAERLKRKMTPDEMFKRMAKLTPQLVIWAHPDVIKAFSRFRRLSAEPEIETKGVAVMFSVEDIFRAIRRDLGHKDALLGKGEILGIYINDIHKHV